MTLILIGKGTGTSMGRARGRIKIINNTEDHEKFEEGDILVTRITDPSMALIMMKAKGIICDIGGITSHPSIVSREMGIPCIVSAKHHETGKEISSVLKDEMNVEIDGSTGEIHFLGE